MSTSSWRCAPWSACRASARIPEGTLIVAFRNVLAHGYATLDHSRVFDAAVNKVPALAAIIGRMLDEFPTE